MGKKLLAVLLAALLLPYVITLAWTGRIEEKKEVPLPASGKLVYLDRKSGDAYMDVEEYLPGVVAKQMPVDYGKEALRAQAVIARTYIYRKLDSRNEVKESELHLEYYEEKELQRLWGSEAFVEAYGKVEDAVKSTAGLVMEYDGKLIEPLFHRASTGRTRQGDDSHPYLQSAYCPEDVEADGYLTAAVFPKEEFAERIRQAVGEEMANQDQVLKSLQIVVRDEEGYVKEIQAGVGVYGGEEIQYALGLPSPSYSFEEYEGGIRAVCKGIGHGYGLSQYTAKKKAEEGWTAEEILAYFYKNIVLISE